MPPSAQRVNQNEDGASEQPHDMRIKWAYQLPLEERSNSINARRLVLFYLTVKEEPGPYRNDRIVVRVPRKRVRRKLLGSPGKSTN